MSVNKVILVGRLGKDPEVRYTTGGDAMTVHICSFSSAIGEMKPRDQRSAAKVLAVLKQNPRFSVFEATERPAIANTLNDLKSRGLIEYPKPQPEYPWSKVKITGKGEELLKESAL